LGEWTPTVFDDETDMKFEIGFDVALSDTVPVLDGQPVIESCERLIWGVESVIFNDLLPTL